MGTTPTYSWPYPEATDPVANGAQDIEDLALAVESTVSGITGGKILQVVSTTKTDTFTTTSTSYTDVTGLSVSITPSSTASKVFVIAHVPFAGVNSQVQRQGWSVFRDSTNLVNPDSPGSRTPAAHWQNDYQNGTTNMRATSFHFLDSPSSTSALTYKVRAVVESGSTAYINRSEGDANVSSAGRGVATITVMEVSA